MTENIKTYLTPEVKVLFTSLRKAKANEKFPDSKAQYSIGVAIDGSTPEGMILKKRLREANSKYVKDSFTDANGDTVVLSNGEFRVTFRADESAPPAIVDAASGKKLAGQDIPSVYTTKYDDDVTAVLEYTIKEGVRKDGEPYQVMRLVGVAFTKIKLASRTDDAAPQQYSAEDLAAKIKAAGF